MWLLPAQHMIRFLPVQATKNSRGHIVHNSHERFGPLLVFQIYTVPSVLHVRIIGVIFVVFTDIRTYFAKYVEVGVFVLPLWY